MKTILITGATGAIGSWLVPLFLAEPETRVYLAIRAESEKHLAARVEDLFDFWQLDQRNYASRLCAVQADVSQTSIGMDRRQYDELAECVTHIVHSAGNVKLNQTLKEARKNAVDSAAGILEFAKRCKSDGQLEKVEMLSTVGVAGCRKGIIPEVRLDGECEYHNTYEAAKAEAEKIQYAAIDRGLPVTIHRPSMVVGDSVTGRIIHKQVFYYLCQFLSGGKTLSFVPDVTGFSLDIVPVDYVAKAIYLASRDPGTAGRIFHLCSGPNKALPLPELADAIFRFSGGKRRPRALPRVVFASVIPFFARLAPGKLGRALRGLPFFMAYLRDPQYFDNFHTTTYMEKAGCGLPAPNTYLRNLLV